MKKALAVLSTVLVFVTVSFAQNVLAAPRTSAVKEDAKVKAAAKAPAKPAASFRIFTVYMDQGSKENHFTPSGWMGDYGDIKFDPGCKNNPYMGTTCIKITYNAKMAQNAGWAGVYWQYPANNWGEKKNGYNLTGATKLSFWARGEQGGEKVAEFKVGGITGEYPDSDSQSIGPIELSKEWQKYTIDLKGKDLSNIIGGFCWTASKDDNQDGFIIYLDEIMYE